MVQRDTGGVSDTGDAIESRGDRQCIDTLLSTDCFGSGDPGISQCRPISANGLFGQCSEPFTMFYAAIAGSSGYRVDVIVGVGLLAARTEQQGM